MNKEIPREYFEAGWHPLELPRGQEAPPPDGRTGGYRRAST